jgi:hypothetical protein
MGGRMRKAKIATARNIRTKEIYEGDFLYISSVVGCSQRTLHRWYYEKGRQDEVYNDYEIVFKSVKRN